MKTALATLLAVIFLAMPAHAQSVSGRTSTGTMRVDNVLVNIANLSAQHNDNMAELQKMRTCMAKAMFYAPGASDADSDGCSKEVDPKIGDANDKLYPNSLCQSTDGKTVVCPTLDPAKILTVMSQAWDTGATRTAKVSCPNGTLRLGCAGARGLDASGNMIDDCTESTCGLVGVTAISNNGCQTTARVDGSSSDGPVVYATCLSLTGSYTPPVVTPPPAPKTCNLPWGGTIASGGSVTAYNAPTVSCSSSCSGSGQSQTRTCTNGVLSGSYTNKTCKVGACSNCAAVSDYRWGNAGMGGICSGSVPALKNGQSVNLPGPAGCPPNAPANGFLMSGKATVTCEDGTLKASNTSCRVIDQGCFVPQTQVTMADGTTKPIKDLKEGDVVRGRDGNNTVLGTPNFDVHEKLYGFNGGKPFVTGGHPFWTQNGWKAVDPSLTPKEHHNVKTTKLKVGDKLYLANGKTVVVKSITADGPAATHHVFNPQMGGDHTYYAGGYLVHNKICCLCDDPDRRMNGSQSF